MSAPMQVDYDPKHNRFLIKCPMWANDMVRQFPAKRWAAAQRAWAVAPVKQNMDLLAKDLSAYCELTPAAKVEMQRILDSKKVGLKKQPFPKWFKFKTPPDPHQIEGLNHLYGLKGVSLHMAPGTGKSKLAADFVAAMRMEGKIEIWLILCKLSLRMNWVRQLDEHCAIPFSIHLPDSDKPMAFDTWLKKRHDFKIMIVGFESLSQGRMHTFVEKFLLSNHKAAATGDETHMISNHQAIRSQRVVSFGRRAELRMALTGTPISTGPMNLFMQYEFVDPEIIGIGDYYAFRNRYAVMGGYTDDRGRPLQIVGYQNMEELVEMVAPYTYSVTKDVLGLPPKVYEIRTVRMTKEQAAMYASIKKDKAYVIDGTLRTSKNALELALRLHQVAQGHLTKYTPEEYRDVQSGELLIKQRGEGVLLMPWNKNPKIQEVSDILEEMNVPTVIWCNYKADIVLIESMFKERFPDRKYATVTGGREKENYANIRKFQDGKLDYIISNTGVGGTGHDMYRAELVVYFNNNERLIDRIQSEDRAHRRGLDHSVLYIDILVEKTVDMAIMKSIELKMNLSDYIRGRIGDLVALLIGE